MKPQKRTRRKKHDRLVLNLLLTVVLVIVIFEGRLIYTMFNYRSYAGETASVDSSRTANTVTDSASSETENENGNSDTASSARPVSSSGETTLAGLPGNFSEQAAAPAEPEFLPTVSDPDSTAIVPKADTSVDDSYFSDAVFIGDSRMEGFRNASGITQGRFFTSVGMSLSSMASDPIISTPEGNITVAAALSGGHYSKIYIMLGTNDLGEYDWNSFRDGFVKVTQRFQEIQPDALIYVCSVIYVDESRVASTEYVNNANVDKINSILLEICEEEGYHYLDFNEFLTSGYGSLIDGASSDGVHLYADYCKQMLNYLKNHYIEVQPEPDETETGETAETEEDTNNA